MQSSSMYMCVASEKIMHFASGRLGIHGYCKEFPKKRRLEYSRHTRLTGLHMETDIWIKGTDIIASHRDTGRIRMGCLHLKASRVGYSTKERKWGEETRPMFPTWGAATPATLLITDFLPGDQFSYKSRSIYKSNNRKKITEEDKWHLTLCAWIYSQMTQWIRGRSRTC